MPREETGLGDPPKSAGSNVESKETGNKIGNASFQVQGEFFNTLQEMSRDWMACATSEIELGVKLSNRLSAARSVPDAIAAYQEWLSEEMGARAEDARRLMSNGQKFMDTSTRLLSNGWSSVSTTT
jgi:hypothetical protein